MRPAILVFVSFVLVISAACRPGPVVPHDPSRSTRPAGGGAEVDRDTTRSVAPSSSQVLKNDGSPFELDTLWETNRVLLVFYLGGWCPHCKRQLETLQQYQKDISDLGAIIVAISVDAPADAKALHDKLNLTFELYSDPELAVIQKWGAEDYGKRSALPASFIIEKGGTITYRRVGTGPTDRPTIEELLAALGKNATPPPEAAATGGGSTGIVIPPKP